MPVVIGELEVVAAAPPAPPRAGRRTAAEAAMDRARRGARRGAASASAPRAGRRTDDRPHRALYAASPTVTVKGQTERSARRVARSLVVTETARGAGHLRGALQNVGAGGGDPDFLFFDRELVDFGAEVEIALGGGDAEGVVFSGHVTGLRGGVPRRAAAGSDGARRGPAAGPADDPAYPHLRGHDRRRGVSSRSPRTTGCARRRPRRPDPPRHRPGRPERPGLRARPRAPGRTPRCGSTDDTLHVARPRRRAADRGRARATGRTSARSESSAPTSPASARTVRRARLGPGGQGGRSTSAPTVGVIAAEPAAGTAGAELLEQAFGERAETRRAPGAARAGRGAGRWPKSHFLAAGPPFRRPARCSPTATRASGVGDPVELVGRRALVLRASTTSSRSRHLFDLTDGYRTQARVERGELTL